MTIYVVDIVDSLGNTWRAVFEEWCDTIQVCNMHDKNERNVYFEDSAYHLGMWAGEYGITYQTHTIELDLSGKTVKSWTTHP